MASRIFAFILWAAVAASLAYWGLRWLAPATGVPASATSVKLGGHIQGDYRRLFVAQSDQTASGEPAPDPGAAAQLVSRLRILGAVASAGTGGGVALMSIDGKPPRAVRVGSVIDGDMVLLALNQRQAEIGPAAGPALARVDLPVLPPPSTGTLPPPQGVEPASAAPLSPARTAPGRMGGDGSDGSDDNGT
ncbi:hypothetical protein GTZ97_01710 [Aquabacterium fontiphilum]|uniref:hypothetical protein n=1 Tax=Aquabacterium fontiphilum TaxID=450365 RepID=UPI00137904BA|nr:hypothetical protein [Aquabacterium fontiphilum]NBD19390.1 hypothetical protein [Aquabacterium fontiphilum]